MVNGITTFELYENIRRLIEKYAGEKKLRGLYKELDEIRDIADEMLLPGKTSSSLNAPMADNIVDEIRNACVERWNTCMELMDRSDDKARIALLIEKLGKGEAIIELGCGGGAIISILEKNFPNAQIVGLDYNGYMIKSAIKNHPKTTFFVRDIVHWGDFYLFENKFDSVIIGSTLHEIVSFYGWEGARNVLEKANRMLKEGGVLIIRDGIGPDDGDAEVSARFKTDFSRRKFFKFTEDFQPWKIRYDEINSNTVKIRKRDFYEYLIKYIYDKPYSWEDEMKEAFGTLDFNGYRKLLAGLFTITYNDQYVLPFFKDKWKEDLEVIGGSFPNSHILLAAEKISLPVKEARVINPVEIADTLVIGSGFAGCSAVIGANDGTSKMAIVTKGRLPDSNTEYAQGGIAAAVSKDDTAEKHLQDTLESGAGLCDEQAVRVLVEEGIERVNELIKLGARFDRD